MAVNPMLGTRSAPTARASRGKAGGKAGGKAPPPRRLGLERLEEREVLDAASAAPTSAALLQTRQFIIQSYEDMLGQRPGITEQVDVEGRLEDIATRDQVVSALLSRPEYQDRVTTGYFEQYLDRTPAHKELEYYRTLLGGSGDRPDVQAAFLDSNEFFVKHGASNAGWLEGVYQTVLGHGSDEKGRKYWLRQLDQGMSRREIAESILGSLEARQLEVRQAYYRFLQREPDKAGQVYFTTYLQDHSVSSMVVQLISSTEYYSRRQHHNRPVTPQRPGPLAPNQDVSGSLPGGLPGGGTGTPNPGPIPGGPVFAPNVNVSTSQPLNDHSEMGVAVNPLNPDNIVALTHTFGAEVWIDAFVSFDGGATWTVSRIDSSVDGLPSTFRFDPTLAFDDTGNLYIGYGATTTTDSYVLVGKSTDGGLTYQTSIVRRDDQTVIFNDKWILATGPAPGDPFQQNVYIAWVQNPGNGPIVISGSADGGVTWSDALTVSNPGQNSVQFAFPAVGPNGEIYVSYQDLNTGRIYVNQSATFSGTAASFNFGTARFVTQVNDNIFAALIPAQDFRGIANLPVMAVDRSAGPHRGALYVAYTDTAPSGAFPDYDIWLVHSYDSGLTWSAPERVNDDTGGATQFNVWMAIDQYNDGCVQMSWRDTRHSPTLQATDIFTATSQDGGQTVNLNRQVTTAQSDVTGLLAYPGQYLEYDGLAVLDGQAYLVWADNRSNPGNGTLAVFFATVPTDCGSYPDDRFEFNETTDKPTVPVDLGMIRSGDNLSYPDLNINRHPSNGLPDYDVFQFRARDAGTFGATISPFTQQLELHLYVLADDGKTLVEIDKDQRLGAAVHIVSGDVQANQVVWVLVKGINYRLSRIGQDLYDLDVSLSF